MIQSLIARLFQEEREPYPPVKVGRAKIQVLTKSGKIFERVITGNYHLYNGRAYVMNVRDRFLSEFSSVPSQHSGFVRVSAGHVIPTANIEDIKLVDVDEDFTVDPN